MFEEAICSYLQTHRFESLNLKAVLFDMDGVLFDSMKNHAAAWHEAMKRYNLQMTPARRTHGSRYYQYHKHPPTENRSNSRRN